MSFNFSKKHLCCPERSTQELSRIFQREVEIGAWGCWEGSIVLPLIYAASPRLGRVTATYDECDEFLWTIWIFQRIISLDTCLKMPLQSDWLRQAWNDQSNWFILSSATQHKSLEDRVLISLIRLTPQTKIEKIIIEFVSGLMTQRSKAAQELSCGASL